MFWATFFYNALRVKRIKTTKSIIMKKYISILTCLCAIVISAQTNYKPLYIYNYSSYDLQIEVNTCNENSVFDGTITSIQWPVLKSPSTFTVTASGGTFFFDYVNATGDSGLCYQGVDVPGPGTGFWRRQLNPTASYTNFGTNLAQSLYGEDSIWWYAKISIWAPNGDYVRGNLGNWENTVDDDGYSILLGNNLNAEWFEIPDEENPGYITTYIIVT